VFYHGGTWIQPSAIDAYRQIGAGAEIIATTTAASLASQPKRFSVSFICGAKEITAGHKLRKQLWALQQRMTIPTSFFVSSALPFENALGAQTEVPVKLPAAPSAKLLLFGSMFHVAIENVSHDDYFTEKIIDCFLTRTIPVYWGCPNIGTFFDADGIIHVKAMPKQGPDFNATEIDFVETSELLLSAINHLTEVDYECRKGAIQTNFERARHYINQRERMERAIGPYLLP
jgi:hypothetical protein